MAKQNNVSAYKAKNEKLLKMNEDLRQTIEGHKQLANVFTAYIALLLDKVGATEDNPILITEDEVKFALEHYETRAIIQNGEKRLFCAKKV